MTLSLMHHRLLVYHIWLILRSTKMSSKDLQVMAEVLAHIQDTVMVTDVSHAQPDLQVLLAHQEMPVFFYHHQQVNIQHALSLPSFAPLSKPLPLPFCFLPPLFYLLVDFSPVLCFMFGLVHV